MISKRAILRRIIELLTTELENLANASRSMHADASDEQNKAEDKYDTRGLETAYLASAQARQATETEQALAAYQTLTPQRFAAETPIDLTALVETQDGAERSFYFLGPKGGGLEIHYQGTDVFVVTPESPIGQQLLGKKVGDRIPLQTRGPKQELRIIAVS